MSSPLSAAAMDSLLRLQGLKNVSGRRRMPGQEVNQQFEPPETDVSGISNAPPSPSPQQNQPAIDLGSELTSQSYDVRANTVQNEPEQPSMLNRFGRALGNYLKESFTPKLSADFATQFPDAARNIEKNKAQNIQAPTPRIPSISDSYQHAGSLPVAPEQSEVTQEIYQPGSYYHAGYLPQEEAPEQQKGILERIWEAGKTTPEKNLETIQRAQQQISGAPSPEQLSNDVQKAKEQPWQYSAYGSAQEVANSPALQAEFKKITGIDYEPQISAIVTPYEEAMKAVEEEMNGNIMKISEMAESIKNRIQNNQVNDADKYYIGLALLMPLLIGGIFGKEAALGALGGGAKGIADVYAGREKNLREDEASLLDLSKQKSSDLEKLAGLKLEKAKLKPSLEKALPKQPNEHLLGRQSIQWQDPNTGETHEGVRILPGLVAKSEYVNTEEGLKNAQKAANELSEVKTYVDDITDLTDDVIEIVSQLDDSTNVWKGFTQMLTKQSPSYLSQLAQDVMFDGRPQNAGVLLEEKLGFLANKYGQAQQLGQLDRAAQAHIQKIMTNPTNSFLTPRDSITQMLEVRRLAQNGLVRDAAHKGFYPEFVIGDLEKRNNQLFDFLNRKDQSKREQEVYNALAKEV